MSDVRDRALLVEMIDAAQKIARWSSGVARADFLSDEQLRSAVAMQILVLGEGARLLSSTVKTRGPDVPWQDMVGMRHRLAHGYARASATILQDVAANWIPLLLPRLQGLLESLGPEEP